MWLKLYRSSSHRPFEVPENAGLGEVERLLLTLEGRGVRVEVVDTAAMSGPEREAAYFDAAAVAVRRHVQVRRVFGSNRASGMAFFGREVPALLVYDREGAPPVDVVPREQGSALVTIRDYVAGLSLPMSVA